MKLGLSKSIVLTLIKEFSVNLCQQLTCTELFNEVRLKCQFESLIVDILFLVKNYEMLQFCADMFMQLVIS